MSAYLIVVCYMCVRLSCVTLIVSHYTIIERFSLTTWIYVWTPPFIVPRMACCVLFTFLLTLVNTSGCFQNLLVLAQVQGRVRRLTFDNELKNFAIFVCIIVRRVEICALLGYYAASCGNFFTLFTVITRRRVISQKSADLINIAAEAWNQGTTSWSSNEQRPLCCSL
jgi:hypothetical protein